jgi:DnaJ-domain-containing protein 1
MVQQAITALRAYLEQAGSQLEQKPARVTGPATKGTGNGRARMSREEALAVLGLAPEASAQEINTAYRRLGQLLDPQLGGTPYLSMKINEAKNVLLRD